MASRETFESFTAEEKRAALKLLLKTRADEVDAYPLSLGQQGIWFEQQLDPQNAAYNIPLVFCISGALQVEVLRRSLEAVVQRHNVLLSAFRMTTTGPIQEVKPMGHLELPVKSLEGELDKDWKKQVLQFSHRQSRLPIPLATGPLFRFELLRLSGTLHALLVTIHHIVFDGWSIGILLREFAELYLALDRGDPSPLEPLTFEFKDFLEWQAKTFQGSGLKKQIDYWKKRLEDSSLVLDLPTDFPRPLVPSYRGATYCFTLPLTLLEKLKAFARQMGATLFMTTLACFCVLLFRISGVEDLIVGISVANRDRKQFWGIIGLFANTIPFRADFSGDPSFAQFLQQVRDRALEDYSHTDVPLPKLVEELKPPRDTSRSPLYQVGFDFQNSPWPAVVGEAVTLLNADNGASKLDLNLSLSENVHGLVGVLEYSTDLFTEDRVSQLADWYERLLGGVVENPDKPVSCVEILSAAEHAQFTQAPNRAALARPPAVDIAELFERQAYATPGHNAITHGEKCWSYRRLNEWCDGLARRLHKLGVSHESRVGIYGERSPELIGAMLGVLKAGGCYVPLDPALPALRLKYIVADSGLNIVLAPRKLAATWPGPQVEFVYIDDDEFVPLPTHELAARQSLTDALAYVIYTSGSTGQPKGVMVPHSSLVNHALSSAAEFELTSKDRILQFASLNFDASVEEIFPCLAHGGTLVLKTQGMLGSLEAFWQSSREQGITILDLPTAYWHELATTVFTEQLELPPALRLVIIGGEAARPEIVNMWRKYVGNRIRLLNTYGPTEATVVTTTCDLTPAPDGEPLPVIPIGKPRLNTTVDLLDRHGERILPGSYGEIFIGGFGVARGYLGRPDLTAENFLPDPFGTQPGARLYRTGDIGRYLSDGDLEFKGRSDGQIKLRGFRIELAEVETALCLHLQVREAVVLLRETREGDKRMIAYLTSQDVTSSDLREWMRERLPDYMVPSIFVLLEAMPKMISGKVDRQALFTLPLPVLDSGGSGRPAQTASEESLLRIWAELLKIEKPNVYDNFFDLGGHSLLATQMLSRVSRIMHVDVPLRTLFEEPTVFQFAKFLDAVRESKQKPQQLPIAILPRSGTHDTFPQSFAQQRLWFIQQMEPGSAVYSVPVAVLITGKLDISALERSLAQIIQRHESLRTTFQEIDGSLVQVIHPANGWLLPLVDLSQNAEPLTTLQLESIAAKDALIPFDLVAGPLFRAQLIKVSPMQHALLLNTHHIITDAWSTEVFNSELRQLYRSCTEGSPPVVPQLTIQYAEFAVWQKKWLTGARLETQLDYWKEQLSGIPPLLDLPTDRPRPALQSFRGANIVVPLSASLTDKLRNLCRREQVTTFMALLGAFHVLLSGYAGRSDLVYGTPVAGRDRLETEDLIGFFVNTVVLRIRSTSQISFRELLAQVRTVTLDAQAHQDVSFEKLVETIQPERSPSYTPIFQVMFALDHVPEEPVVVPGLEFRPLNVASQTAKFDLTLAFEESQTWIGGVLEYSTDLFDEATMERFAKRYLLVLESAVENPEALLSDMAEDRGHYQLPGKPEDVGLAHRPAPREDFSRPQKIRHEYVAPRSPMEMALTGIWQEILQQGRIGVYDNFFELGGHSLLAIRVVSRVRKTLGIELPLISLFEEPTVSGLAHSIEHQRWSDTGLLPPPLIPIVREPGRVNVFPQSFAQQSLWFLEQLEPNTATYNVPSALRLQGELNLAALDECLNELIRRHESLRTTFGIRDDQFVQIIAPELHLNIAVTNLEALPEEERELQLRRLVDEETQHPFDLTQGPLLRVTLLRLSEHEHVLHFNIHHIITDAWSVGVLVQEMSALYSAFCQERSSPLPPLPIQYADFSQWQFQWFQFGVLEQLLFYWEVRLKGAPVLELPTDRPRGASTSSAGADVAFHLDQAITKKLKDLGRQHGATLFMVLLASFKTLLYRYTGQVDVVIGTPIANRQHAELEGLIGFFVNTLVLRTDLSGNPSFGQLITRVRDTALSAYAHQDLPFERLVEQLGPQHRWGRDPLFQVMFILQNAPISPLELPGLDLTPVPLGNSTAKFDLTLQLEEEVDGISGVLEYRTDLFDGATVERFVERYRLLLEMVVENPDILISDIPLLSGAERQQLVTGWNETDGLEVMAEPGHRLFEAQVARTPNHTAVSDGWEELSYAQLNARANQLAHHLMSLGIGAENRVGICLPRSVSMVVAVLGVWKAGAAYVPLDPAYPGERLAYMLEDAGVGIVVTEVASAQRLSGHVGGKVLLDQEWECIAEASEESPEATVNWENLAYVIYTSGSTGRPKGVMIEHRSCVTFVKWAHTLYGADEMRKVLASTSLCFDLSVFELIVPLSCGGEVVVVDNALALKGQQDVTLVNTVPSVMAELVRSNLLPASVRTINLAGEALPLKLVQSIREKSANARIVNLYGPSEDTTYSTYYEIPQDLNQAPYIGRPISRTQAYVLDESMQLVPAGVTGEIYLGGAGLARGYLGRPDLTAEKFLPNPFHEEEGRLYKTGDRGRYQVDGKLEYVGRADHQVKIRGFRIELEEIEMVVAGQAGVSRAAVLAQEDNSGDKHLVAYIERQQPDQPTAGELRDVLKQRLPEFMIPSAFVFVAPMPLSANGKIDRRALPPWEDSRTELRRDAIVPPRNPLETQLIEIWQGLLGRHSIGIRDNFFEIGGHSLLALRLQAQVRNSLGVEFPLAVLFMDATVESLAKVIRTQTADLASSGVSSLSMSAAAKPAATMRFMRSLINRFGSFFSTSKPDAQIHAVGSAATVAGKTGNVLVPIRPDGTRPPFFCVHPIGGNVMCYAELARHLSNNQPFYGIEASSPAVENESMERMAARYVNALLTVHQQGPFLLGGWSMGGMVAYEMAQQLLRQGNDVGLLVLLDSFPLDPRENDRSMNEKQMLEMFIEDMAALSGQKTASLTEAGKSASIDEHLALSMVEVKKAGIVSEDIDLAKFSQLWRQYRNNYQALVHYEPQKYKGKITLIMTADQRSQEQRIPIKSWGPLAGGGLTIDVLPGDHYTLLRHPNVRAAAAKLEAFLDMSQDAAHSKRLAPQTAQTTSAA